MTCSHCGQENPPGSRFCNACGERTDPLATTPAPQTYTPQHLSERILTSRAALIGERKQVTVLFADLEGSMQLLAHRDPEEARRLLDAVVERMMEAVHRYEGTVNQVMGDGIMALFGAPLAHEDHAVRACYAALRMQETVTRYAEEAQHAEGVVVRMRVGLNSGEVVVRSIGGDLHMDYTAVGQTTHLAARMEQMAAPGSILITPSTLRLAEAAITVRPLGRRVVKGLEGTVKIYELTGAVPKRSILKTTVGQRRSRFVGRQEELDRFGQILSHAEQGHGQVAAVSGEPGVGKSRLVYEFIHSTPQTRDWQVLECRSFSYEVNTPWAPVVELLRRYVELDGREGPKEITEKVSSKVSALDQNLGEVIAPIGALLNGLPEHDAWYGLDAPERRRRVLDALTHLFLKEAERRPLLLVFENLQWVDTETRALLDSLVEHSHAARLMLLVNYRPEFKHEWTARPTFNEIALGPLPPEAAERLLETMLRGDRGLSALKKLLAERSQGNPFFLEEIVHTLLETKALVNEHGMYRLTSDLGSLQVPATIQAVLAARIDRLSVDKKRLLQSAAVIGMDVPAALLETVTDLSSSQLESLLAELVMAGLLEQTPAYPDIEYRFRSALTRDVASASLLREQRRTLHARIAEAIETLYRERLSSWIDSLAHHTSAGDLWSKAARYNRQAGARAAAHAANVEAARAYEAALHALSRLPQTRDTIEESIDVRLDMRAPLLQLGRLDRVLAVSREAEGIARKLGDEQRLARAYAYLVNYHYLKGETEAAIEYGQRCLAVGQSTGDVNLQRRAAQYIGQSHHLRGDFASSERILRDNLAADADRSGTIYIGSAGWLAWGLAERGEFEAACACLDPAHRAAEQSHDAYSQAIAWAIAGLVAIRSGHLTRAVPPLGRSLEISRRKNLTIWEPIPSSLLGLALVRIGHVAEGLRLLEDSVASSRKLGVRAYFAAWMLNLAEGYLADEQFDRAAATAHEALDLAEAMGERGHQAYAQQLLGDIAARTTSPDLDDALMRYEASLRLATTLGLRPLIASVHIGLHRLHVLRGDEVAAKRHATLARKLVSELGLHPWWERSEETNEDSRLFIVARSNTELFEFLSQDLAGARDIEVILDRRQADRRGTRRGTGQDRRREQRRRVRLDDDLRNWHLATAARKQD
jgi:class 3 adenylate cyclase/tetratricopeptide (TPR) repeat protein